MKCITCVINRVAFLEEFEGRVPANSIAFGEVLLLCCVNLRELDRRFFLQQLCGCFGVFRSERLAVSTPWCICHVRNYICRQSMPA